MTIEWLKYSPFVVPYDRCYRVLPHPVSPKAEKPLKRFLMKVLWVAVGSILLSALCVALAGYKDLPW